MNDAWTQTVNLSSQTEGGHAQPLSLCHNNWLVNPGEWRDPDDVLWELRTCRDSSLRPFPAPAPCARWLPARLWWRFSCLFSCWSDLLRLVMLGPAAGSTSAQSWTNGSSFEPTLTRPSPLVRGGGHVVFVSIHLEGRELDTWNLAIVVGYSPVSRFWECREIALECSGKDKLSCHTCTHKLR